MYNSFEDSQCISTASQSASRGELVFVWTECLCELICLLWHCVCVCGGMFSNWIRTCYSADMLSMWSVCDTRALHGCIILVYVARFHVCTLNAVTRAHTIHSRSVVVVLVVTIAMGMSLRFYFQCLPLMCFAGKRIAISLHTFVSGCVCLHTTEHWQFRVGHETAIQFQIDFNWFFNCIQASPSYLFDKFFG